MIWTTSQASKTSDTVAIAVITRGLFLDLPYLGCGSAICTLLTNHTGAVVAVDTALGRCSALLEWVASFPLLEAHNQESNDDE